MLGEEKNYLQLAVGPWQCSLVLEFVVLLKGRLKLFIPALCLEFGNFPALLFARKSLVTSYNMHPFVSMRLPGDQEMLNSQALERTGSGEMSWTQGDLGTLSRRCS